MSIVSRFSNAVCSHVAEVRRKQDEFNTQAEKLVETHGLAAFDRYTKQQTLGGKFSLACEAASNGFHNGSLAAISATVGALGTGLDAVCGVIAVGASAVGRSTDAVSKFLMKR